MKWHYIVVDIETTWLSRDADRITEIGAVRFDGDKIIEEWQTLVNPQKYISPYITKLTGITNDMVGRAPTIDQVLPEFLDFMWEDVFVAHNAGFDYGFLSLNADRHLWHAWDNDVLCTRKLANRLVSHLPRKWLWALCDYFGIVNAQAHRALADVHATTEVLRQFLQMFHVCQGTRDIVDIIAMQHKTVGYGRKIFGKYEDNLFNTLA
jgi:DNA polymerase III epsilon subunit family exonuclease